MKIKIGTRGSKLALWQAEFVAQTLQNGGLETEIVIIETKGDKILDRSLSKIGSKGVFTEELEEQLRTGEIDIAQHSAKDLQSSLANDLELIAFTEREQVNDVLVSFDKSLSLESGKPFVIGTSSTRRVAMLRQYYPHIQVVDMRGNLQTRLRKLEEGHCDALLLAYAGVHRMGYDEYILQLLDTEKFTPAVGQGSVAIECTKSLDTGKKAQIRALLNHEQTEQCILTERAFLATMQGGCSIPVFGLALPFQSPSPDGAAAAAEGFRLRCGIISLDGQTVLTETVIGTEPLTIGHEAAIKLLQKGGAEVLKAIRQEL